ncbi:hypothetical protein SAMN05421776_105209 [Nocardia farcinica]|uniref:Uncharacterized protein n=1 Tax=Nocardia farcinica TaxID=37329 RepID=A0A0H5NFJ3_NOCFR|nr:hypothetical protein [Nocardia farcinica]AXK88973.1 hypothetical protein DXT66_28105 [Nocardia farcinica]PFX03870.1 hypothetical protein CJ469_01744 [Nocardia farcinica]PFX10028.1 hypothetical protein CJ468_00875 [Nocardia farcinica]CRY73947.1 Uncharacterised protein [Nocardia farcinica]SIT24037.1 hypothetical protein SAMN05421776_105209 [Nocardia farcinica]
MSEDQSPRPMANMLTAAREGALSVAMTPEDFVYIDRDCEFFKNTIRQIQRHVANISEQSHWGLGEDNAELVSARTVVERFRKKARDGDRGNSVWAIMEQHYQIVEDIQAVYRLVRERMMQADSEFASALTTLNETLPERPPEARTPQQALDALAHMPGLGPLFASAPSPAVSSPWPTTPTNG